MRALGASWLTLAVSAAPGALPESISSSGPGSFGGPFVAPGQAIAVLAAFIVGFAAVAALVLRRRDVTQQGAPRRHPLRVSCAWALMPDREVG